MTELLTAVYCVDIMRLKFLQAQKPLKRNSKICNCLYVIMSRKKGLKNPLFDDE